MHYWGDNWFKEHGDNLYKAISILENRMRKWAKVGVCGKEKWGCYRDEYLTLWDGGLSQIFFGYKCWYGETRFEKFIYTIDYFLIPYRKTKFGWLKVGLADFNRLIGLRKLVNWWQTKQLNKAFQITCKEYPDVVDELVMDVDCYDIIKPCKWGNVDGEEIHNKHWKPLVPEK